MQAVHQGMQEVPQGGVLEEAIQFFARIKQRAGKRPKSHSPPSEHMHSDPKLPIACHLLILPSFPIAPRWRQSL